MTTVGWPRQNEMKAFYGNPDSDADGAADRAWEDANLVRITPAFDMILAWDPSVKLKSIRIHRRCSESLTRILYQIAHDFPTQQAREAAGVHLFGGSYSFRMKRGGTTLSTHSFGCAIDLNPAGNPMGKPWKPLKGMLPQLVIAAFKEEGWVWGGDWKNNPDPMHFQAARL